MRVLFLSLLIVMFFLGGCSRAGSVSEKKTDDHGIRFPLVVSNGTEALFCFKCHSHGRFMKGVRSGFSHERHKEFIHCSGCHEMKMHDFMRTKTDLCRNCHNLGRFTYKGSGMKTVFDHASHAKRNTCKDCHPEVFIMKKGAHRMTMADINQGRFCGVCHNGKRAFSSDICNACHEM